MSTFYLQLLHGKVTNENINIIVDIIRFVTADHPNRGHASTIMPNITQYVAAHRSRRATRAKRSSLKFN